jgi:hypothetical protein
MSAAQQAAPAAPDERSKFAKPRFDPISLRIALMQSAKLGCPIPSIPLYLSD